MQFIHEISISILYIVNTNYTDFEQTIYARDRYDLIKAELILTLPNLGTC